MHAWYAHVCGLYLLLSCFYSPARIKILPRIHTPVCHHVLHSCTVAHGKDIIPWRITSVASPPIGNFRAFFIRTLGNQPILGKTKRFQMNYGGNKWIGLVAISIHYFAMLCKPS